MFNGRLHTRLQFSSIFVRYTPTRRFLLADSYSFNFFLIYAMYRYSGNDL